MDTTDNLLKGYANVKIQAYTLPFDYSNGRGLVFNAYFFNNSKVIEKHYIHSFTSTLLNLYLNRIKYTKIPVLSCCWHS